MFNRYTFGSVPFNYAPDLAFVVGAMADTVAVSDTLDGMVGAAALVDTVTVTDSLTAARDAEGLADTVTVTDAASAVQVATALPLADAVAVADEISAEVGEPFADTVTVTDTLLAEVSVDPLTDAVAVTDTLGVTVSHVAAPLADIVTVTDAISEGRIADPIEDSVTVTDVSNGQLALVAVGLEDVVALADSLDGTLGLTALFEDVVVVSDTLGAADVALVAAPLLDTVRVTDALVLTEQRIVVTNAETGAVSTYDFPVTVTGLAEFRGVLYVAASDGLYALDAVQDETGAVVWTLATGFGNLGTDLLKRVPDLNIQGRTEGDLTVAVTVDRTGTKREYMYRLPALTRDSYRDGVAKIGKGLQSVYWGLALRGQGPAEIDQLRPRVEPLSRRR